MEKPTILACSVACNELGMNEALYSVKWAHLSLIPPKQTKPHFLLNGTPQENPLPGETFPLCTFYTDF